MAMKIFFAELGKFLLCVVGFILIAVIWGLMIVCCHNPILFPIWAALFPQSMAGSLVPDRDNEIDVMLKSTSQSLLMWEIKMFPWRMRRHFVEALPHLFSEAEKIQCFFGYLDRQEYLSKLSSASIDALWATGDDAARVHILNSKKSYSRKEMEYIIDKNMEDRARQYAQNATFSKDILILLIEKLPQKLALQLLINAIRKNGLTPDLLRYAQQKCQQEDLKVITDAAETYSICWMVKSAVRKSTNDFRSSDENYSTLLQQVKEFPAEAEMLFSPKLLRMFYEDGRHLHKESIIHILTSLYDENMKKMPLIFKYEKEHGLKDTAVADLVKADPQVLKMYLEQK